MGKNNLLALFLTCCSFIACSQNKSTGKAHSDTLTSSQTESSGDSQDEPTVKPHSGPECGCGLAYGAYGESYKALEDKDWRAIEGRLDTFLNIKDIKKSREFGYSYHAHSTLMRMHEIEWTTHKGKALKYLETFVKTILAGDSYLNAKNKNKMYQKDGCPWGIGDALGIPRDVFFVILKIDADYGVQLINNMWDNMTTDEPFSNSLRRGIIRILSDSFKNSKVQSLLTKIEKSKLEEHEVQMIKKMKFEYEISKMPTQTAAWNRFIAIHKDNAAKDSVEQNTNYNREWYDNLMILHKIFTDVDVAIPLKLAEKEQNFTLKCGLAQSCCMILNREKPKQTAQNLMTRIDELVEKIKQQPLDKNQNTKSALDDLNRAYQALKGWHK